MRGSEDQRGLGERLTSDRRWGGTFTVCLPEDARLWRVAILLAEAGVFGDRRHEVVRLVR
jgi:hypothetical protein